MKQITKIRLNGLHEEELSKKEQKTLIGGGCLWCSCSCKYAGTQEDESDNYYGGASSADNDSANDGGWFK